MSILSLKFPIPIGERKLEKLTFRDFTTAADYLAFDQRGGVAQRIALIASLTGNDEEMIKRLRGPDYLAAERIADQLMAADHAAPDAADGEDAAEKKSPAS